MILIVLLILVLAAGGCLLAIRKEINGSASVGEPVSVSIQQGSFHKFYFPNKFIGRDYSIHVIVISSLISHVTG